MLATKLAEARAALIQESLAVRRKCRQKERPREVSPLPSTVMIHTHRGGQAGGRAVQEHGGTAHGFTPAEGAKGGRTEGREGQGPRTAVH